MLVHLFKPQPAVSTEIFLTGKNGTTKVNIARAPGQNKTNKGRAPGLCGMHRTFQDQKRDHTVNFSKNPKGGFH